MVGEETIVKDAEEHHRADTAFREDGSTRVDSANWHEKEVVGVSAQTGI